MTIQELEDKIIDLEDFFKRVASRFNERAALKRLCFLLPSENNGNYITKYATFHIFICLSQKNIHRLNKNSHEDILCPHNALQRCGLLRRMYLKIYWKIRLRDPVAIMPIYRDREIACIILFFDRLANDWLSKHSHSVDALQREIAYCLEAIILYNQALERIIREYGRSNRRPVGCVDQLINEQASVLIGKKVEFL